MQRYSGPELLKTNFLSGWPSFIKEFLQSRRLRCLSMYTLFSFELPYNLHLGISMLVKKFTVIYLSADRFFHWRSAKEGKGVCKNISAGFVGMKLTARHF